MSIRIKKGIGNSGSDSGGGGTSNYSDLTNKPQINGVTLSGNKTTSDLGITIPTVNNPAITITQGGTTKGTFTLNQSSNQTIALDSGGGSADLSKINNYTPFTVSNNILSITSTTWESGDRWYFTPKFSVKDIFTADRWKLKMKFKYLGDTSSDFYTVATMGVAPLSSSSDFQGFAIKYENENIELFLSSDGESWDIASGADSYYVLTEDTIYEIMLEFTGHNYILSIKGEDGNFSDAIIVNSSTKISTGNNDNTATIIFGNDPYTGNEYQMFADWYLGETYLEINGKIISNLTYEYDVVQQPEKFSRIGTDDLFLVVGGRKYDMTDEIAFTDELTIDGFDGEGEALITFTTGENAPQLTDNSNLTWAGGKPTMSSYTSYTIIIYDNVAYYKEF